jgi:hypothetical protein
MTITADTEAGVDAGERARQALELLTIVDVEAADRRQLELVMAARRSVAAVLDAIDVRVARRSRQLAETGGCEPAAEVLREHGRRSGREAAAAARREQACTAMPALEAALADGDISAGHLDAITTTLGRLDEDTATAFTGHEQALVVTATQCSVETFERHCRDLARTLTYGDGGDELTRLRARNNVRRWIDRHTGMHHLHAELDPESAAKVWAAITHRLRTLHHHQRDTADPTTTLTYAQLEAKAFVELVTCSDALEPHTPEVLILIDLDTLRDGLHGRSVCETADGTALPPTTVRRLCCTANLIPVVLDSNGEALDVGRAKRLATPAQRRALLAMYSTCAWPCCAVPIDRCEIHHPDDWLHGGVTSLDNLIPICTGHHHLIHDGNWQLTLKPHRNLTITRPDGTTHYSGTTTTNRRPAA